MKPIPSTVYSDTKHRHELAAINARDCQPTILDVGGYKSHEQLLAPHIKGLRYVSINVGSAWYQGEEPHIYYDGKILPFRNSTFPCVICVDTLEHIVASERNRIIQEMLRVASERVVIVAPFSDNEPLEKIFEEYANRHGVEVKPSFREHLQYGLPTFLDLQSYADSNRFDLTYATPKEMFWHFIMAQLFNNISFGIASDGINKKLQELMEAELHLNSGHVPKERAYRAVLVIHV